MNIIAMDDELDALTMLENALREAAPEASIAAFQWSEDVLAYAEKQSPDVAFLDIRTVGTSGLILATQLNEVNPRCNIIFVTGFTEYSVEAMEMHASGYIAKPVTAERVRKELQNLRYPVLEKAKAQLVNELGPYSFDHEAQRVYKNGKDLLLKPKEFRLLCVFADAPNVLFSHGELFQRVWGSDAVGDVRTVYAHVSRLRNKLEISAKDGYDIESIRNEGYRLNTPKVK